MYIYCTFIRGVLAHPRGYTFDHGWERAELRASVLVYVSQKSKVYLRPAPPLTVVAPFFFFSIQSYSSSISNHCTVSHSFYCKSLRTHVVLRRDAPSILVFLVQRCVSLKYPRELTFFELFAAWDDDDLDLNIVPDFVRTKSRTQPGPQQHKQQRTKV